MEPTEDSGTSIDAPSDSMIVMTDAPGDGPTAGTCSTGGFVCTGTAVAITCNGSCWVKCQTTVPVAGQNVAAVACAGWGGSLAPIRNTADQACVAQMLFPSQAHWIGLEQDSTASLVTAGWTWNGNGVAISYDNWGNGQPNDANGTEPDHAEQCAFMNTAGDWHDTSCTDNGLYRFSCRKN
ncbi:MAG TPA: C-type lectin domain-containing protein [Kofleriaceae bacterium]